MKNNKFLENKGLNQLEFEQKKRILASRVMSLVVTLTTRCNISCIMCEEKHIHWDIPKKVIQEIIGLFPYFEQIIWQGGEILLLDYFGDLLEEANRYPYLYQSFITNGLPITEKLIPKLVRNNIELVFSIDGTTKEVYEYIRKGAKFDKLLRNIRMVNAARKSTHLDNFSFRMHAVIMKSNYRQLEEFIDFAREYEFNAIHLMPIWGNLNSEENIFYRKDKEALRYIQVNIPKVKKKVRKYQIDLLNSLPSSRDFENSNGKEMKIENQTQDKGLLCRMPWKRMVVNPAGLVCPACHCKVMVGNVLEESLSDIWNNEKMQLYRQKIISKDHLNFCNSECINGTISEDLRGLKY